MAQYAAWSVVYGEQPSTAKWNILGNNDLYFQNAMPQVGHVGFLWGDSGAVGGYWIFANGATISDVESPINGLTIPNLVNAFIRPVTGNVRSIAQSGGTDTVSLLHTHTIGSDGYHNHSGASAAAGNHGHSGGTDTQGYHGHSFTTDSGHFNAGGASDFYTTHTGYGTPSHYHQGSVDGNGNHSHGLNINGVGDHTHGIYADGTHSHGAATGGTLGSTNVQNAWNGLVPVLRFK